MCFTEWASQKLSNTPSGSILSCTSLASAAWSSKASSSPSSLRKAGGSVSDCRVRKMGREREAGDSDW